MLQDRENTVGQKQHWRQPLMAGLCSELLYLIEGGPYSGLRNGQAAPPWTLRLGTLMLPDSWLLWGGGPQGGPLQGPSAHRRVGRGCPSGLGAELSGTC